MADLLRNAEKVLCDLMHREIVAFARKHSPEVYYGFVMDCNFDYADVILCFNTLEDLEQSAASLSEVELGYRRLAEERRRKSGGDKSSPQEIDIPERREEKRWSPGDWKWQGTAGCADHLLQPEWQQHWDPIKEEISNRIFSEMSADDDQPPSGETREKFIEMLYRVLFQLEKQDVFGALKKTADFKTLIMDHDESLDDSWARMAQMRNKPAANN